MNHHDKARDLMWKSIQRQRAAKIRREKAIVDCAEDLKRALSYHPDGLLDFEDDYVNDATDWEGWAYETGYDIKTLKDAAYRVCNPQN